MAPFPIRNSRDYERFNLKWDGMRAGMCRNSFRIRLLIGFAAASLPWLLAGCLNLNHRPLPPEIMPTRPVEKPAAPPPAPREESLSGALDGPTLRLAMRDLAVILDTLGRLEQFRPEYKTQMLAELADADAATAAAIVKKWRGRLVELQASAERVRRASAESKLLAPPAPDAKPAGTSPVLTGSAGQASTESKTSVQPQAAQQPDVGKRAESLALASSPETLDSVPCEELLETLLSHARDRADTFGPDSNRSRVQIALLELLSQSGDSNEDGNTLDPELWSHLAPAIEYCLGAAPAGEQSADEAIRSLQVATELMRGPRRFQARGLSFCKRIRGFGSIDRVETTTFGPGQPMLLYSEVEHFFSEPDSGGFRTRVSSTLELLDANGRVAWRQEFAPVEDRSTEPRRDFFLSHRFRLPGDLKPGLYSVRLTLRDELTNRTTSSGIALSVR
jgi:hypothetical protein